MSDLVRCTIDGLSVEVPKGTTILEAAARAGIDIPHYCYHPALSAPAQCRICLVEVEGVAKLVPACVTAVSDGAVVRTQSDAALEARNGVMEFLLINHPLDCPVCDQSGECGLQDYAYEEGRKLGRLKEPKRVIGRDDFGGDVLFEGDRCILCTRCVRFMREIARDERLAVVQRGDRNTIDTFFERGLEGNIWASNIVDICPVGALLSKDFLHKARAWDLDRVPSVCPSCSHGCNIRLEVRDNQVMRLKPRPNPEVNSYWMCDVGRFNYRWLNRPDRLEAPLLRQGDRLLATTWSVALADLVDRLRARRGGSMLVSPFLSNEDLGAARRLADALGLRALGYRVAEGPEEVLPGWPKLKLRRERAANVEGARRFGFQRWGDAEGRGGWERLQGPVVVVVGDELADAAEGWAAGAEIVIVVGTALSSAVRQRADAALPATTFAEMDGTFTNAEGRVQRFWPALRPPGMARPTWQILGVLLAGLEGAPVPASAADAFALLGEVCRDFAGLRYEDLGPWGRTLPQPATLEA